MGIHTTHCIQLRHHISSVLSQYFLYKVLFYPFGIFHRGRKSKAGDVFLWRDVCMCASSEKRITHIVTFNMEKRVGLQQRIHNALLEICIPISTYEIVYVFKQMFLDLSTVLDLLEIYMSWCTASYITYCTAILSLLYIYPITIRLFIIWFWLSYVVKGNILFSHSVNNYIRV